MNVETQALPTPAPTLALLDDQRVLLDSLARVLASEGMHVVASCSNAADLMDQLRSRTPDVLLIDLRLSPELEDPSQHAWHVIQMVRMHCPSTRVIVLSGSRDPADVERAERARVSAFLNKDELSTSELIATISRVLRGERIFPMIPLHAATAAPPPLPLGGLTEREVEVLRHVGAGYDNLKIAACLGITERTVRAHVSNLYRKLGPENRAQLALLSRELGLRPPER